MGEKLKYCPKCFFVNETDDITCFRGCKSSFFSRMKLKNVPRDITFEDYVEEYERLQDEQGLGIQESEFVWLYENCLKNDPDYDNNNYDYDLQKARQDDISTKRWREEKQRTAIYCPNCGSGCTEKISTTKKVASTAMLGLASRTIGKNYKCKDCGYIW